MLDQKNKPFPARDFKKDPDGINWLMKVRRDAIKNPWKTGNFEK